MIKAADPMTRLGIPIFVIGFFPIESSKRVAKKRSF
jgi:hypothetical protein